MKKKQIIIIVFLVLMLVAFNKIFMSGLNKTVSKIDTSYLVNNEHVTYQKLYDKSWRTIKNSYFEHTMNGQDWYRWKNRYKGKIKTEDDAYVAINTMIASLDDPYSRYMSSREFDDQKTSIESTIFGIGVNITSVAGKTIIVSVVEGTPAAFAQIKAGDIVFSVDGVETNGMSISEVAKRVKGPENSVVELVIIRDNQKITKKIKRKEIQIKTIKYSKDKEIGYIQISTFIGKTTPQEFIEAIEKLQGAKGLIIDLRGNTGGLLPNAVFIANLFINNGNIVSIVGRNGYKKEIKAQHTNQVIDVPVVVLINGTSASASEILSGALKDYHIAKLVGTKSYGKGMVQKIIPMPNKTGINLTIAKYLTPLGYDINKKGIEPDIEIELTNQDFLNKDDRQLREAKNVLNGLITKETQGQ